MPSGGVSAEPKAEVKAAKVATRVQEKERVSRKEKAKAERVAEKVKVKGKVAAKVKAVAVDAKEEASIKAPQKPDTPMVKMAVKIMIMITTMITIAVGAMTKKEIGMTNMEWSALQHTGWQATTSWSIILQTMMKILKGMKMKDGTKTIGMATDGVLTDGTTILVGKEIQLSRKEHQGPHQTPGQVQHR